jgi:hypothetical protein
VSILQIAVRVAILLVAIVFATWFGSLVKDQLNMTVMPINEIAVHRTIMTGTVAFVILLAIPFVPGAEIGLTMLAVFGAAIAPLVYGATVLALLLAFLIGRLLPERWLVAGFRGLRMERSAVALEEMLSLEPHARLERLMTGGSPRLLRLATRHRYLALILAINMPGNVVIGGGGGIAMMAGASRLFTPLAYLVAVMVAVSPVPIVVTLFGA